MVSKEDGFNGFKEHMHPVVENLKELKGEDYAHMVLVLAQVSASYEKMMIPSPMVAMITAMVFAHLVTRCAKLLKVETKMLVDDVQMLNKLSGDYVDRYIR